MSVKRQNDFRLQVAGATISGRPDIVAWRDDEAVIVDAKAAKPNPSHEIQVMLYMTWLPLINPMFQKVKPQERCTTVKKTSLTFRPPKLTTGSGKSPRG